MNLEDRLHNSIKAALLEKHAAESTLSEDKIQAILKLLGPNVPREELMMGIEVEKEHGPTGPKNGVFDVTKGDMLTTAKIAAAHLAELPDYYTRLKKMEAEGEAAMKTNEEKS